MLRKVRINQAPAHLDLTFLKEDGSKLTLQVNQLEALQCTVFVTQAEIDLLDEWGVKLESAEEMTPDEYVKHMGFEPGTEAARIALALAGYANGPANDETT